MGRGDQELEVNELEDNIHVSVDSRLSLFSKEFGFKRHKWESSSFLLKLNKDCRGGFVIHPNGRYYKAWTNLMFACSIYSAFFTPVEFGFFRGLPENLSSLDYAQVFFVLDTAVRFFVAFLDPNTCKLVCDSRSIAINYLKGSFIFDALGCFPWDFIFKATGKVEAVRWAVWIRLFRARKVTQFFKTTEKDIRVNYLFTRIVKLITVELYCTHTAASIFYYLATTLPPSMEGRTWIGSLTMGDFSYTNFRQIDFWTRYVTSLYFAIVTIATVGYGDIHAVNTREMVFIMVYILFDMILGAYLIGNMTALMVKGSKTERFRDKMADLTKYMNRNRLGKEIRAQVKDHLRLQYEIGGGHVRSSDVLRDIPEAIRSQISQSLYVGLLRRVPIFRACSDDFLNHIVMKLNEEFFLPGEVLLDQGCAVDQVYIVAHGQLEEVVLMGDGSEEFVSLVSPYDMLGAVALLCNIQQPYTVRVTELCQLLRMEKQSLSSALQIYFKDATRILNNMLQCRETGLLRTKRMESDISCLIARQEAELSARVNSAAFHGDLYLLKGFIHAGADPNKLTDYHGRTPLHMAASMGYEDIVKFLLQRGADVNRVDKFGNSALLEAVKGGHDRVAALMKENGAAALKEQMEDAGDYLCKLVVESKTDTLRRMLVSGVDPNSKNYDRRTPLHLAAAEGLHVVADILIQFGADLLSKDRWGNTPLDEGRRCGSKPLIKVLEDAREKSSCH